MARRRLIIISRTWVPSAFQSRWSLHVRGARSRPCGKFTWNRLRLPWREAGRTSPCPGLRSIPCASCLRKARWQGTSWIIFWYPVVGIRGGRTLTGFWKISGWSITPQTTLHLVFHKRDHLTSNNAALSFPFAFLIHQGMACHIQRLSPCFWHNSRKFPKCARHPPMWRLEL